MSIVESTTQLDFPATPWGNLPPRMRVLFITGTNRTGGWLADAFAADSASEVIMEEALGVAAGVAKLRDEIFDAVLISHEKHDINSLELLDAIRTGSSDEQPIIVLGSEPEQQMSALCFEAGADAYICVSTTTTRTLIWQLARAAERQQLIDENRRLQQAQRHRLQLEHDEAARLLEQQRSMIDDLISIYRNESGEQSSDSEFVVTTSQDLPEQLVNHYHDLLKAHVILGSGNLSAEMHQLSELLAKAGISSAQAMRLHLHVLEGMIEGLGSRSARHVMNRADLLILEVMMNLAEEYRERFRHCMQPVQQLLLPGFDKFFRA
jgi:DNA-binding response OmpR family regulator